MANIIGRFYKPYDNSYCINIKNKKPSLIVQKSIMDYNYVGPDEKENGAEFKIICNPYMETIDKYGEIFKETFINVQSSITNNIYRILYYENYVI